MNQNEKDQDGPRLSKQLCLLPYLDILTTFASHSTEVYQLIRKVKIKEKEVDLIQSIIDQLLADDRQAEVVPDQESKATETSQVEPKTKDTS